MARAIARTYALEVCPDWWLLEPQPDTAAWQAYARVITANDGYCRGMLLGLATAAEPVATLAVAAALPLVRGFVAGGSIVEATAAAWLVGTVSDETVRAALAERFGALADAWSAARDPRLDRPQRSAIS